MRCRSLALISVVVPVLVACSDGSPPPGPAPAPSERPSAGKSAEPSRPVGAAATWDVDLKSPPTQDGRRVTALVMRMSCSSGKTGRVLEPLVVEEDTRVVVTYTVEPLPPGAYNCLGNEPTVHTFTLQRQLGTRPLIDGTCLAAKNRPTVFCQRSQRWPLDG